MNKSNFIEIEVTESVSTENNTKRQLKKVSTRSTIIPKDKITNKPSLSPLDKVTDAVTTPYEYSAIIYKRALMLMMGEPSKLKWDGPYDPIGIAKKEVEDGIIPVTLTRKIPDGSYDMGYREETWDIKELNIRDY